MRGGALADTDALALEVGDRLDRRGRLDEDRLAVAIGWQCRDIDDVGAGRLAEDRRRVAGPADVDGADIEGLYQRRASGELDPLHGDARERFLDHLLLLGDHRQAGLLIADVELLQLLGRSAERQRSAAAAARG